MAERIKAGIFDVGGVLNRFDRHAFHRGITEAAGLHSVEERAAYHDLWPQVTRHLHTGGMPEPHIADQFRELTGIDLRLPQQPPDSPIVTVFSRIATPNEETLEVVKDVKAAGLQVAILSDSTQPHASVLEGSVVYAQFDKPLRVLSHEMGIRKPDPEIYAATLDRLDVEPQEAFFTDDTEKNVDAANRLGIHGILFQDAEQLRRDIRELGVPV